MRRESGDPAILRRLRANANLDGALGIDDALTHGAADERAMRQLLPVVAPGVLMRIELHQRERPVFLGMRFKQRPGDKMVAAEREEVDVSLDDRSRLRLDLASNGQRVMGIEGDIAVVDRRKLLVEIEAKRVLRIAVENGRRAADRLRTEARPRPVRDRNVERDPEDREVDAGQIAAVTPPHERQCAGKCRIVRAAFQSGGAERMVDWRLARCLWHSRYWLFVTQRRRKGARSIEPPTTKQYPVTLTLGG